MRYCWVLEHPKHSEECWICTIILFQDVHILVACTGFGCVHSVNWQFYCNFGQRALSHCSSIMKLPQNNLGLYQISGYQISSVWISPKNGYLAFRNQSYAKSGYPSISSFHECPDLAKKRSRKLSGIFSLKISMQYSNYRGCTGYIEYSIQFTSFC